MLWDIIRDWFVEYVWGGYASNDMLYGGLVGHIFSADSELNARTNHYLVNIGSGGLNFGDGYALSQNNYITIGDWLSTTSTIITLLLMVIFLYLVVRYMFRLTSGLFRGR